MAQTYTADCGSFRNKYLAHSLMRSIAIPAYILILSQLSMRSLDRN